VPLTLSSRVRVCSGEVIASSGGAFGSVFIEEAFISLLQKIFGTALINEYRTAFPIDFVGTLCLCPLPCSLARLPLC
jgi:hypothetical protein